MKYLKNSMLYFSLAFLVSCNTMKETNMVYNNTRHFEFVKKEIRNPSGKYVLVAAHRGDWRHTPENSLQALKNCIAMGVDIVEFDIRQTKDGEYIVMHDETLDRSTTGKGKVKDYTLSEIRQLRLKDGLGQRTDHLIPTFEEMMLAAKGKIVVNIDKGYNYFDDVVKITEKLGMYNQTILSVTGQVSYRELLQKHASVPDSLLLMPVIGLNKPGANAASESYNHKRPLIYQFTFDTDTSALLKQTSMFQKANGIIWFNSLWPHQNAGHDDDKAVEENKPDETWGWLIKKGATIIQTDRPKELLSYLRKKGLHP